MNIEVSGISSSAGLEQIQTKVPDQLVWQDRKAPYNKLPRLPLALVSTYADAVYVLRSSLTVNRWTPYNYQVMGDVDTEIRGFLVEQASTGYLFCVCGSVGDDCDLYRSVDLGITWVKVQDLSVDRDNLMRSFCDLGAKGLLYASYTNNGDAKTIYKSIDDGASWTAILTVAGDIDDPVRHFHGIKYDSTNDLLFIMTGDDADQNTILVCRTDGEIDDFLLGQAGSTTDWAEVWGLKENRAGMDEDYILNNDIVGGVPTTQRFRTVDIYTETYDGVLYAFWGVDSNMDKTYACTIQRANLDTFLADGTKNMLTLGDIAGEGFYIGDNDGVPIFSERSIDSAAKGYDGYVHWWTLTPDRTGIYPVIQWLYNTDSASLGYAFPLGDCSWLDAHVGYGGSILPTEANYSIIGNVKPVTQALILAPPAGTTVYSPGFNLIANSTFEDTTGWTTYNLDVAVETLDGDGEKVITDITQHSSAPVVTSAGHGYLDWDKVTITDVVGDMGAVLNGNTYVVSNATTDTYELLTTDTDGEAYTSGGVGTVAVIVELARTSSLRVTANAAHGVAYYVFTESEREELQGSAFTFSARIFIPDTVNDPQDIRIYIDATIDGTNRKIYSSFTYADGDDDWHDIVITCNYTGKITLFRMAFVPSYDALAANHSPIYLSHPVLVQGNVMGGVGSINPGVFSR